MATLAELENALRKADAAGNADDARALAGAIRQMRQADFGNVEAGVTGTTYKNANDSDFARLITGKEKAPEGGLGRELGLGARAMLRGAYSLPGIVVDPLVDIGNRMTGGNFPKSFEAAEQHANILGLPAPATATERVGGDITSALTGGGGTMAAGRALARLPGATLASRIGKVSEAAPVGARGVGQALAAQPAAQTAGLVAGSGAAGTTREAGGGQGAQLVAGLAGSLVPGLRPVAGDIASGVLKTAVPQARKEIARAAKAQGIELSPGQLSDSRFLKWAQSMLRSVPFTGAVGRYQKQVGSFNRALAREIGEDAANIGPGVMSQAKARQSAQFDDLTSRNALKVDDQLVRSLSNIAESAKISPAVAADVESAIDRLYAQATTGKGGVVIPGAAYQAFDSELGQLIKGGGAPAHFLGNVQSAMRRAMDKSISPRDAEAWRQLRREYGSRKALAPLAAKAEEGDVKPGLVLGAATSTRAGKEAMAEGRRGNLGQLARIGQLMKEPPSSGSAERAGVGAMLGGATYFDPVSGALTAAAVNLLSRGLDSHRLAELMIRENPGLTMETAQKIIERSAVPAAITTTQNREPR